MTSKKIVLLILGAVLVVGGFAARVAIILNIPDRIIDSVQDLTDQQEEEREEREQQEERRQRRRNGGN